MEASVALVLVIKASLIAIALYLRRGDRYAADVIWLYTGFMALRYILFPVGGIYWYVINAVSDLIFAALMVVLFDQVQLTTMIARLATVSAALNVAATFEYNTDSVIIYSAYPIVMQTISVLEVGCLLFANTSAIRNWSQFFQAMHYHETRKGKRRLAGIAGFCRPSRYGSS